MTERQASDRAIAPRWVRSLALELQRGRQVIITGRVRDRWWLNGEPATFQRVLAASLYLLGSEVVAWWDPVEALSCPLPGHQEQLDKLVKRAPVIGANAQPEADHVTPRGSRRSDITRAVTTEQPQRRLATVDDVLLEARRLTSDENHCAAFVFADLDLVLTANDPATNRSYLMLRSAMSDAVTPLPSHRPVPGPRPRNPVLAVVGSLGRLPEWLYQEDPRIVVLHIDAPDQAERRRWFSMIGAEFNGGRDAAAAEFEPLVSATDGMAGWELDALARTSHVRDAPLQQPGKLIDRHRVNVNTDPWTQVDRRTIASAGDALNTRVIGQRTAVDAVVGALQSAYVGIGFGSSGASRPRGAFFFVGPTGVGKTELAKSVAQLIFGDPGAYARFDMSEYQQEHAAERLAGAPPGYIGHEAGGELTRRVQERPFSVLLFDEIEKAHPAVLDKFLQILEDGRLTDGQGRTAYFSQSLIIFTSNTGADGLSGLLAEHGSELPYPVLHKHFTEAVERKFRDIGRPEIYGRLKPGVVVFDMLRTQHVVGIAERLLAELAESVRERHQVELVHDEKSVHTWITERMSEPERQAYGGRQIRNEFEPVLLAVVQQLLKHPPSPGDRIRLAIAEDGTVHLTPEAPDPEPPAPGTSPDATPTPKAPTSKAPTPRAPTVETTTDED